MIIELKEYKLPKDKRMHDADAYTETGLFLVNDGVCLSIVAVPVVGEPPLFIPVPFGELSKYIRHQSAYEALSGISSKMTKQLEDISLKLDVMSDAKAVELIPQMYHEEKIDGSTLLKAIALAQNPELAEKLLKEQ